MKIWVQVLMITVIVGLIFAGFAWLVLEWMKPAITLVYSFLAYLL